MSDRLTKAIRLLEDLDYNIEAIGERNDDRIERALDLLEELAKEKQ